MKNVFLIFLLCLSVVFNLAAQNTTIIEDGVNGAVWQYYNFGSPPWNGGGSTDDYFNVNFTPDANWEEGKTPWGYDLEDLPCGAPTFQTCNEVNEGNGSGNHLRTAYFRHEFNIADLNALSIFDEINVNVVFDDAIVLYLNGVEIFRQGFTNPPAIIGYGYGTGCGANCSSSVLINPLDLEQGNNVLAAQVHQSGATSMDFIFSLTMTGQNNVVRGPYLQRPTSGQGNGSSTMTVKWRTNDNGNSRCVYYSANSASNLTDPNNPKVCVTGNQWPNTGLYDYEATLTNLNPSSTYFYTIGEQNNTNLLIHDEERFFRTSPVPGNPTPLHAWVLGDAGSADDRQRNVRNAYINHTGGDSPDMMLFLGDNAYDNGTDTEFQAALFENMYEDILKNTVAWSCLGNHEATAEGNDPSLALPYYNIFSFPINGASGGYPSNTEAYYSYDYGDIHFIVLNSNNGGSYLSSTGSDMYLWLQNDLSQSSAAKWRIAYWHHPSYSTVVNPSGGSNDDADSRSGYLRSVYGTLLEQHGVDLVLYGHQHHYSRTSFLHGLEGNSASYNAAEIPTGNTVGLSGDGHGQPGNGGIYCKGGNGEGAVYVISGNAGSGNPGAELEDHSAVVHAEDGNGSTILTIENNCLRLDYLRSDGTISDHFIIDKNCGNTNLCSCGTTGQDIDAMTGTSASTMGLGNLNGGCLSIAGKLIIDTDITWTNVTLKMDPGAEIVVQGNNTLTVTGSNFNGCTQMWKGITVRENGTLVMTNNTIRNAQYAITKESVLADLELVHNIFENNYIAIRALAPLNTQTETISNNAFTSTAQGMLSPYPGQIPNVIAGNHSKAAFYAKNTTFIYDEADNAEANSFVDLENGFIIEKCVVSISWATMDNMIGDGSYVFNPNDIAWLETIDGYGISTTNSFGTLDHNTITDANVGIYNNRGTMETHDNVIGTVSVGIRSNNFLASVNRIRDNTINDFSLMGIRSFSYAQGLVAIHDNVLTSSSTALPANTDRIGIDINGIVNNLLLGNRSIVDHNDINMLNRGSAIHLANLSRVVIQDNDIDYNSTLNGSAFAGIRIENAGNNFITSNTIDRPTVGASDFGSKGIWTSASLNNSYCCNTTTGTAEGITFEGDCFNSKLWSNTMHNNSFALICEPGTMTGQQGHRGNIFTRDNNANTIVQHLGNDEEVNASTFFIENTPPDANMWPDDVQVFFSTEEWFDAESSTTGSPSTCPTTSPCTIKDVYNWPFPKPFPWPTDGEVKILSPDDKDAIVAQGLFASGVYGSVLSWEAQRNLYYHLKTEPGFSNVNSSIDAFNQANTNSNLNKLHDVGEALASLQHIAITEQDQLVNQQNSLDNFLDEVKALNNAYTLPNADQEAIRSQLLELYEEGYGRFNQWLNQQSSVEQNQISNVAAAITLNNTLSGATVYENNEKQVNDIYLQTIAQNIHSFTASQQSALFAIANTCPFTNGYSVYRSRELYRMTHPAAYFDDDLLCQPPTTRKDSDNKSITDASAIVNIYPNPTDDYFDIQMLSTTTNLELHISSVTGQELKTVAIPSGQESLRVNTTELPQGIYYISIYNKDNDALLKTQKLVILR